MTRHHAFQILQNQNWPRSVRHIPSLSAAVHSAGSHTDALQNLLFGLARRYDVRMNYRNSGLFLLEFLDFYWPIKHNFGTTNKDRVAVSDFSYERLARQFSDIWRTLLVMCHNSCHVCLKSQMPKLKAFLKSSLCIMNERFLKASLLGHRKQPLWLANAALRSEGWNDVSLEMGQKGSKLL